jgi:hypothetical protein
VVIGVGVKSSTSDLLMSNCDEFIFYDDLVRSEPKPKTRRKRGASAKKPSARDSAEDKQQEAFDLVQETFEALQAERSSDKGIWGSMIKQALKRRKPGFNETHYGFKTFSELLEEAEKAKLLKLQYDEKSGGYIVMAT